MPASITITPLDPDRVAAWRAFYDDLSGPRRASWAQSQRRRGVRREAVWLAEGHRGPAAVVLVEGPDPQASGRALETSDHPFDVWFREQLKRLTGESITGEAVFDSRVRPGSWREWGKGLRR